MYFSPFLPVSALVFLAGLITARDTSYESIAYPNTYDNTSVLFDRHDRIAYQARDSSYALRYRDYKRHLAHLNSRSAMTRLGFTAAGKKKQMAQFGVENPPPLGSLAWDVRPDGSRTNFAKELSAKQIEDLASRKANNAHQRKAQLSRALVPRPFPPSIGQLDPNPAHQNDGTYSYRTAEATVEEMAPRLQATYWKMIAGTATAAEQETYKTGRPSLCAALQM